jgi:Na+/H+-dicarboxylate symporter
MTFRKPKLHTQIVIGLILGALFGALFNINRHKLEFTYTADGQTKTFVVEEWQQIDVMKGDSTIASFGRDDQIQIIQFFKKLKEGERKAVSVWIKTTQTGTEEIVPLWRDRTKLENIKTVEKVGTIATAIKPIGTIFIRLLSMIAVPLVLASLIVGAASLGDIRKVARIGGKTLTYYLFTTALAISIGLLLANAVQPGERMSADSKEKLLTEFQEDVKGKIGAEVSVNVVQMFVDMVPRNPIGALANGDMLAIVFFAVITGVVITLVKKEKALPVVNFFDGLSDVMIKMVDVVMLIAPYAVFALIAATVGEFGFDILQTLIWYSLTVVGGLAIHLFVSYPVFLKIFTKMKISTFFKGMRQAQLVAFTTSSSAATLPVNMECCEEKLGVPKSITSFVLPLGATINMDGTALYQGVAAAFIAQVYGFDLNLSQQLTIVLTATLASIGTAPVPGVGIIMLIIVLRAINVPEEGIALILGVDRILDMCRTVLNITGDASAAVIVAHTEGVLKNPDLKEA